MKTYVYSLLCIFTLCAMEHAPKEQQQECPFTEVFNKAIFNQNETLFYQLLDLKPDLQKSDFEGMSALHVALKYGTERMASALLGENINVNALDKDNCTVVHYAVKYNISPDFLERLLKKHAPDLTKVDVTGRTALAYAMSEGKEKAIDLLLQFGASIDLPNADGVTPLFKAIREDNEKQFEALIKHDVKLNYQNKYGQTALVHALLYAKNEDIIVKLLEKNVDVDVPDVDGKSAIHWAMIIGCRTDKVLMPLIAKSKNLLLQDVVGHAPIHKAVLKSYHAGVQALVKQGASCNVADKSGKTPLLHQLAINGSAGALRNLILLGADPNLQDNDGNTPLHLAIKNNAGWISPLIQCGAVKTIKNNEGKTPYDLAREANYSGAITQLENN